MQVESGLKHGLGSLVEGAGVVYKGSFKARWRVTCHTPLCHMSHTVMSHVTLQPAMQCRVLCENLGANFIAL